jgi:hypothetical protein
MLGLGACRLVGVDADEQRTLGLRWSSCPQEDAQHGK